jgi:hypothetical protein
MPRGAWTALVALFALAGCSQHALVDAAMMSAYRPPPPPPSARWKILAGDMHCHVRPPDPEWHVDRGVEETLALAQEEHLDFVVLTPHVRARFFEDEAKRDAVVDAQRALDLAIHRLPTRDLIVLRGLEYTDFDEGHLTLAFAEPADVLAALPLADARMHPGRFFERWVGAGGLVLVNHPVLTPTPSPFRSTRADMSWRPLLAPGPHPEEIETAMRVASGVEVFNLAVTHLRDGLLLEDPDRSLRRAAFVAERYARKAGRPLAAVGGSDSHTHHLRPVMYVLAEARTPAAVRDAIVRGRTCVRSPEACTFEVRAAGGAWSPPGASLHSARIEARASGDPVVFVVNGVVVARAAPGAAVALDVDPSICSTIHAVVGEGQSSPAYANCPF